jgi:hypothetical protein
MKTGRMMSSLLAASILLGAAAAARAEEITLKDGQKIVGTIVGYEQDMFRVETSYGIALVRKDKVASIQVSKPDAAGQVTKSDSAKPEAAPTGAESANPAPARPAMPPHVTVKIPTTPALAAQPPAAPPAVLKPPAPGAATASLPMPPPPPPPPASHPLDVPMPAHLEEHVDGNTYFSDTFQFSMYKPPDWKIFEGVPKATGSGIMAMGTDDELTLLIVDRQVWSGTPKLTSDQVEAGLRQTYQDYHRISEEAFACDGLPATHRTFTGILDGAEWHGVAVHVIHGNMVFGIIGLTSAETYQFQEAIFNKIIRTFHFIGPATPSPGSAGLPKGDTVHLGLLAGQMVLNAGEARRGVR